MAKVVIDPGHGGRDPGAIWKRGEPTEKEINLDIALKVRDLLMSARHQVVMTRDEDVDLSLKERVLVGNRPDVSCFVSIHTNSAISVRPKGFECYYYLGSEEGRRLAELISQEYRKSLPSIAFRGIKPNRSLYVLRKTRVPAVLVEVGFISNAEDRNILYDEEMRGKIASGIASGIRSWVRTRRRRRKGRPRK